MSSRRWGRQKKKPKGYDYLKPVLDALDSEMREAVNAPHEGKTKSQALWPIHQINWQRSRYIYDMFYKYKKISRELYEWCLREKLCDKGLCAKWKKPGYERLCSVQAIKTNNTNYGSVSICRVPRQELEPGSQIQSQLTGCRGCASGKAGYRNIFGNKYGQYLAAIQIAREEAAEKKGKTYVAKKEWTFAMDDDEEEEALEQSNEIAKNVKRKADEEEGSWLGGADRKKRKMEEEDTTDEA